MQIVWEIKFMDLDLESEVNWVSQRIRLDQLVFLKLRLDLTALKLLALVPMEIVVQHYLVSPLKYSLSFSPLYKSGNRFLDHEFERSRSSHWHINFTGELVQVYR